MLSCRSMKGPLIFVSVLMHRETNLQVENEETIEAQSARTPKRCWTESNSAFSFVCANFPRWCRGVAPRSARPYSASHCPRFTPVPPFSSCLPVDRRWRATACMPSGLTRLACAKSVRYTQLSPTARSGKSVGSSPTKQNAEEGVRLDEKRRTMDRGTRGGWRRSYGVGSAWVCPRFHGPPCGRCARSGAIGRHGCFSGRCVRIHMNCRSSDLAPPACVAESGPAGGPAGDRCLRIDRLSRKAAFPRLLHPDDIAAAHRDGRTTASECAAAHACARFTGKRA
ncbi:hypothetical protein ACVK00_005445 [Burkholderia sp. PvR073]